MRRVLVALALVAMFALPLGASTYVVNDNGDAGDAVAGNDICDTGGGVCTLRAAIEEANAHAGADTIAFTGFSGTFTPATAYDAITEEIHIDGTTGTGYLTTPVIIVDGNGAVATGFDFTSTSNSSTVRALFIVGFTTAGIHVDADSVTIRRNFIGPAMGTGTANGLGIHVGETASGTIIGGGSGSDGNLISGNTLDGILIDGDDSDIVDNFIGTQPGGTDPLGNLEDGIHLTSTADGNDIGSFNFDRGNIISANTRDGIYVGEATNTTIFGNTIGLDSTGSIAFGNGRDGVGVDLATTTAVGVSDGGNVISGNLDTGVFVYEGSVDTTIEGNTIGLDSGQTNARPNLDGIYSAGTNTIIGTTVGGNFISGNDEVGIFIEDGPVTIRNNVIGLDPLDAIVGNGVYGIAVSGIGDVLIGGTNADEGNTISGNGFGGISLFLASNVEMFGNVIGLTKDGTDIRGNGGYGIELLLTDTVTIGSVGTGRNIISGNSLSGIDHVDSSNVTISGNRIGTDITGMSALGNLEAGVEICDATFGVTVSDNLISGNDFWGVWLMSDANGNTITNNIIGLNADQSAALPNGDVGVLMTDDVFDNVIGPGNIISGNGGFGAGIGVAVVDAAINNKIEGNSIFDNADLGIDLGGDFLNPGDGVTPNDDDDPDVGSNGLQNFPVLTAAVTSATASSIQGTFNSTPDTLFSLHFYENTAADPSGFGEGQTYLGTTQVTTDASGDVTFAFDGPALTVGNMVTATATSPTDGTSEFSGAIGVLAMPTVQFDPNSYVLAEGGGSVTVTVTRTGDLSATTTVEYTTSDNTALDGSDYTAASGTITFLPTEDTQTFNVPITDDASDEPSEFIDLTLSNPNAATLGANDTATIEITDNDAPPEISIDDVAEAEGDSGTTSFTFTVSLSAPSAFTVTVNAASANNTAVDTSDYTALPSTLITFNPGDTSEQITVDVNGDTTFESDETFFVNLSGESNGTIDDEGQGTGTITNDDGQPTISIDDVTLNEGDAGTTSFTFTLTLSNASDEIITVNAESADDTAVAGTDYTALPSTLVTFNPGDTSEQVTVDVTGDTTFEGNDTFFVNLSGETNATIGAGQGLGTITNDDGQPEISIDDVTLNEGDAGATSFTFTISLSNASDEIITVNAASADDTAVDSSDYTALPSTLVTFNPGDISEQVTVDVNGDTTFEATETFFVNLSGETNATIDDGQGLGTITNDDGQPEISIDDVTLNEGDAGTTSFTFTISLSNASDQTITLNAESADDTADATDYTALPSTLVTFNPGDTSEQVTVDVTGDTTFEATETFFVNLSGESNATIGDGQGLGTITNDDAQPEISIDDVTLNEGDAGTTSFTFTISLTNASDQTITVNAASADDTAVDGTDYTALPSTLITFNPGDTSEQVTVDVTGDTTFEPTETFFVNLSGESNATIDDGQGLGTITNDDGQPEISIDDVSENEGDAGTTPFTFTVSLSNPSQSSITVDYATQDDTALEPGDYTAVSATTITFDPLETTQTVTIDVNGDVTTEGNERFFVNLSNPQNATIDDGQGDGLIQNDDGVPSMSIDDVTLGEGDSGTTTFTFTVTLSTDSDATITVLAETADDTAAAGSDYTAVASTMLTFAPGVTSQQFTVDVSGDTMFEDTETFFVNLSGATNASISDDEGLGTIGNDDAQPEISIDDVTLSEGNPPGSTAFTFTVSLSNPSESTITVNAATADDTAAAGSDYAAVASTMLTFNPGVTSQPFTVNVTRDATTEPDETFFVNLSGASNATFDDPQGLGTITNDDGQPAISIDDVTLNEGDAGTTAFTFTVSLSNPSAATVTVNAATADDTASSASDYTAVASTMLTFDPGVTSQTFTVDVNGDTADEADETFFVNLSGATNASIADDEGLGTITNDDGQPTISIDDVTLNEGDAGTTSFTFTLTLSNASNDIITVNAATADGTAVAGTDYTALPSTLVTFNPGDTSEQVTVDVTGDTTYEGDDTFFVNLSGETNATIADGEGLGTITNDDGLPAISIDDVAELEGDLGVSNLTFTISLTNASDQPVTVTAETQDDTAVAGPDYSPITNAVITFDPGVTTRTFTVSASGDTTFEADDTFFVNLTLESNATMNDSQGIGTILNDDTMPEISIDDVTRNEGNAGTTTFTFTISLSNTSDSTITVIASSADDTATAGSDYTTLPNTLVTFDPGVNSQQVTVNVSGETLFEGNETFFVNLGSESNATIADGQGLGTITNDDGQPTISIDDVTENEGDAGTTAFTFTVSLSNPSASTITVNAATANGTASSASDYAAVASTLLTFNPGVTSQPFTVNVNGDTSEEGDETFFVNLGGATNATITDDQGLGTITNDDGEPTISIDDVTLNEGDAGTTTFTFTVSLSNPSASTVTVNAATANGTASSASDYTAVASTMLTFSPGVTSQPFTVNVNGDTADEGNETFFVNLSGATNATIADDQGLGTITDDDGQPMISIDDVTVNEGDAGTTAFTFTVSLSNPSASTITVNAATANGTASSASDYTAVASTMLTFSPGVTSQPFTVNVNGDTADEGNETFFVNLSGATNATIADDQGLGTITDDDGEPTISIDDVTLNEGNAGTTAFTFTVSLSNPSASTITVNAATANGTASSASDYTAVASTMLTFNPGVTSQPFTVNVAGDPAFEPNETFFVNLSGASNATIDDDQGIGTITNDDGEPTIAITDVTQGEGDAGTTAFVFNVTLTNESASTIMVDYDTADLTATAGADYTAASDTLTFAPGTTLQTISIDVAGDVIVESDEIFHVNLSNAQNAAIADDRGVGTIDEDDAVGSANLVMQKTAPSTTFIPGQQLTFTLTVRNDGPDAATNITVIDPIPANTTFVSATSATASCNGTEIVICTIPTLANGATATISLVVGTSGTDDITNTATASAAQDDANVANNSASVTLAAAAPAGAAIPTASEWGLLLLIAALALAGALRFQWSGGL